MNSPLKSLKPKPPGNFPIEIYLFERKKRENSRSIHKFYFNDTKQTFKVEESSEEFELDIGCSHYCSVAGDESSANRQLRYASFITIRTDD